ncbi:Uncharacterised protein [Mycobacteroides abscessus]|nr:Uncharacterised protein [Mycobacteroides abscessus]
MPVCVSVTVALTARRVSSRPIERPTVTPRPTTTTSLPAREMPCRSTSSMIPRGVHGSGDVTSSLTRSTSRPRLVGCSPSASLAGSMSSSTRFVSMPRGSGSCTMYPVQAGSSLRRRTAASMSSCVASPGRSSRIDASPTSAQSRCLPATYHCDPGSSPTRSVPSPGTTPFSARTARRSLSSALIVAAVALPSRIRAVTAGGPGTAGSRP